MSTSDSTSKQMFEIYKNGSNYDAEFYTERVWMPQRTLIKREDGLYYSLPGINIDSTLGSTNSPILFFDEWQNFTLNNTDSRGNNYAYSYGNYTLNNASKIYAVFLQVTGGYSDCMVAGVSSISGNKFTIYVTGTGANDVYNKSVNIKIFVLYRP